MARTNRRNNNRKSNRKSNRKTNRKTNRRGGSLQQRDKNDFMHYLVYFSKKHVDIAITLAENMKNTLNQLEETQNMMNDYIALQDRSDLEFSVLEKIDRINSSIKSLKEEVQNAP